MDLAQRYDCERSHARRARPVGDNRPVNERREADAIVVGAGLAGLVATAELADAGRRVIVLDQEPEASLGGQAFWSLGGLFLVDSARAAAARDPRLARARLAGLARHRRRSIDPRTTGRGGGPRLTSSSPRARSARGCAAQGVRVMPNVGWAERGGYGAIGHGNSVPRFHLTWGTGPGVLEPFVRRVRAAASAGSSSCASATASTRSALAAGAVDGVAGRVLAPDPCRRAGGELARGDRRVRAARAARARLIGRHRRQPRARAAQLARAARRAAAADGQRRARRTSTGG